MTATGTARPSRRVSLVWLLLAVAVMVVYPGRDPDPAGHWAGLAANVVLASLFALLALAPVLAAERPAWFDRLCLLGAGVGLGGAASALLVWLAGSQPAGLAGVEHGGRMCVAIVTAAVIYRNAR